MQLVSVTTNVSDEPCAAVLDDARGLILCTQLSHPLPGDAMAVLSVVSPDELRERMADTPAARFRDPDDATFVAPYRHPRKIWGIGINYSAHAADLGASAPQGEPASFIKGDHTIIGPGEAIELPSQSQRVTAEAELGLIFGAVGRNVPIESALDSVWGACTVLDQTAEDILQVNPRYLTRAKNFPGFFSFGPGIVPLDEILAADGSLDSIEVSTILNGEVVVSNTVRNMLFSPHLLVSFHSAVMPWYPGDILSTGTPGAVKLSPGDVVGATVTGLPALSNPVIAAR